MGLENADGVPQPGSSAVAAITPATQGISQFALTMTPTDILVTVGQLRVPFNPTTNNQFPVPPIPEWLVTLSMSPSSARVLVNSLQEMLKLYEEQFGEIPYDKSSPLKITKAGA